MTLMPQIAGIFNCTVDEIFNFSVPNTNITNKINPADKVFLYPIIAVSLLLMAVILFFTLTYSTYTGNAAASYQPYACFIEIEKQPENISIVEMELI